MDIYEVLRNPDFNTWMEENIERVSCVWKHNGGYHCEIYADYRDKLDKKTIETILESPDPFSTFYDHLMEAYADTVSEYECDIMKELMKLTPDDFLLPLEDDEIEDVFREWIMENVYFDLPERHYLDQDVCVDIMVDVGDGNYDFTMNALWGSYYDGPGIVNPSAMMWLIRQQGYEDDVTQRCIDDYEKILDLDDPTFMTSVREECLSLTTHMSALTFLVSMPLSQLMELNTVMSERNKLDEPGMQYHPYRRKYTDYITISTDATCGLYDPWNGSGSEMDIQLEKEIILPIKFIDSAMPDGWRGYGVKEIYGVTDQWWEPDCVKITQTDLPKEV